MLTPRRRKDHWRVNRKWEPLWHDVWVDHRGIGKWYKRRLSRAERRFAKAQLKGLKGKEPSGLRGEVNWRGW